MLLIYEIILPCFQLWIFMLHVTKIKKREFLYFLLDRTWNITYLWKNLSQSWNHNQMLWFEVLKIDKSLHSFQCPKHWRHKDHITLIWACSRIELWREVKKLIRKLFVSERNINIFRIKLINLFGFFWFEIIGNLLNCLIVFRLRMSHNKNLVNVVAEFALFSELALPICLESTNSWFIDLSLLHA